jgi:hypothetical protein
MVRFVRNKHHHDSKCGQLDDHDIDCQQRGVEPFVFNRQLSLDPSVLVDFVISFHDNCSARQVQLHVCVCEKHQQHQDAEYLSSSLHSRQQLDVSFPVC